LTAASRQSDFLPVESCPNQCHTNSLSLANFVGCVVGFLNVLVIRLRSLLLAAALSFESEMVSVLRDNSGGLNFAGQSAYFPANGLSPIRYPNFLSDFKSLNTKKINFFS
jgi:hypothetical protein